MNSFEARKIYVEALRSGKYVQITGFLSEGENKRCCLGVACDIYKQITGKGEWVKAGIMMRFTLENETNCSIMPADVYEFFGFDSDNPFVDGNSLANWNDVKKLSFEKIADLVEKLD